MDVGAVVDLVRAMPGWAHADPLITPIDTGITNRNFRVEIDGAAYVVRLPGERTELLGIDRAGEAEAAAIAARLGIGPPVRGELPGVGTLVTQFVAGEPADVATLTAPGILERLASAIRDLHRAGAIAATFPIFRVVEAHARDAAANGVTPPPVLDRLRPPVRAIERAFDADRAATVVALCHNDLLPANVLLAADRMWLIDYEYAGMNHPVFDLANLSVNCGFDAAADRRLLAAYDGDVSDARVAQLELMKIVSELREGMWAVVQQAISTLTHVDFAAYASARLEHCAELCADPRFATWLEQARA